LRGAECRGRDCPGRTIAPTGFHTGAGERLTKGGLGGEGVVGGGAPGPAWETFRRNKPWSSRRGGGVDLRLTPIDSGAGDVHAYFASGQDKEIARKLKKHRRSGPKMALIPADGGVSPSEAPSPVKLYGSGRAPALWCGTKLSFGEGGRLTSPRSHCVRACHRWSDSSQAGDVIGPKGDKRLI